MSTAADRVEAFLDSRTKSPNLDQEHIHAHNDNELTVSDLRHLISQARGEAELDELPIYFLKDESGDSELEWWIYNSDTDAWFCFDATLRGDEAERELAHMLSPRRRGSMFKGFDEGVKTLIERADFGVSDR